MLLWLADVTVRLQPHTKYVKNKAVYAPIKFDEIVTGYDYGENIFAILFNTSVYHKWSQKKVNWPL